MPSPPRLFSSLLLLLCLLNTGQLGIAVRIHQRRPRAFATTFATADSSATDPNQRSSDFISDFRSFRSFPSSLAALEPCYPPPCPGFSLGDPQHLPRNFPSHVDPSEEGPTASMGGAGGAVEEGVDTGKEVSDDLVSEEAAAPEFSTGTTDRSQLETEKTADHYLVRVLHAPPVLSELPNSDPRFSKAVQEIQRLDGIIQRHRRDIQERQKWLLHSEEALRTLTNHVANARATVSTLRDSVRKNQAEIQTLEDRMDRNQLMDRISSAKKQLERLLEDSKPLEAKTAELLRLQENLKTTIRDLELRDEFLSSKLQQIDEGFS